MIFIGSRYEKEPVSYVLDGRSNITRPTVMRSPRVGPILYGSYTEWNAAYRLDQVADRLSKDSERWWKIMDANADVLNPWGLESGTRLNLP